jgi:hypothetical protein
MPDGIELYLIQSPDVAFPANDNVRDYNRYLLKYYETSIPVRNITDFITRVIVEVGARKRRISKLVIGSHGDGVPYGTGYFHIGETLIDNEDKHNRIDRLKNLAPFFEPDAEVYILACHTGFAITLLQKVSKALGGIAVHGYTGYITTTNYLLGVSVDDDVGDEFALFANTDSEELHVGKHVVCWPTSCMWSIDDSNWRVQNNVRPGS